MEATVVFMFMKPTGDSFPGNCSISPGDRNANRAVAINGAAQLCISSYKDQNQNENKEKEESFEERKVGIWLGEE
uniref:Uncharacterized protein n=1 Tax=Noccaea caerulescens TaxID=107243 RepID=A0A1J3EL10_NOCCA